MEIHATLIAILRYLEVKFDYGYFIIFLPSKILLKKLQSKFPKISNFWKFNVQSLDIATLLGAEGPQQGPQGPKGPEGPPALRRS